MFQNTCNNIKLKCLLRESNLEHLVSFGLFSDVEENFIYLCDRISGDFLIGYKTVVTYSAWSLRGNPEKETRHVTTATCG